MKKNQIVTQELVKNKLRNQYLRSPLNFMIQFRNTYLVWKVFLNVLVVKLEWNNK